MYTTTRELPVSKMAEQLVGSEIIKLAGEVKQLIAQGNTVYNFTIGDFEPDLFPIPEQLLNNIIEAYKNGHTNYPASNGIVELRKAVSNYIKVKQGLDYSADEFLISGGARPLIYACYQALVDPNDKVIFPVPSWNNNHYTHLSSAQKVMIEARSENNFMPLAEDIKEHIQDASLVALCSPLNPTGTAFSKEQLEDICKLILEENQRRGENAKPVYLMYDQIYWQLTYGETVHYDPVSLFPEMRDYTIYIDGISKAFAATGVRVGWAFGPQKIINKMKAILGHVGAWSPKAEQFATAQYMEDPNMADAYLSNIKEELFYRLKAFYTGIKSLAEEGLPVDVITPQAALYLTVKVDIVGARRADGSEIQNSEEATAFILNEAGIAVVPFYAFGTDRNSPWYRLSVGTSIKEEIPEVLSNLKTALQTLSF